MDFEMVLEGFWKAKILDFRSLFDVFSKSFLKRLSGDENGVPEGGGEIEQRSTE